ncbi:FAD binding domain-containing protein [Thermodesulfobacteriota bacterium]
MQRLNPFTYFEPTTLAEAFDILSEKGDNAFPFAGGTDLLVRMKRGLIKPSVLVNLKRIPSLQNIYQEPGKGTTIGALASIHTVNEKSAIKEYHPVLSQAAGKVGSPSIRNLGTIGGNIGRASPASDMAPPLMVLGASVATEGPFGKKEWDIEEFITGPGSTKLSKEELITSFFLPEMAPRSGTAYLKLGRRKGMDVALVGVAVLLTASKDGSEAEDARIAMASVGPVPLRSRRAEELLLSGTLNEELFQKAARAAAEDARPITDLRASSSYRTEMVRVLTHRAILTALNSAQGGKKE